MRAKLRSGICVSAIDEALDPVEAKPCAEPVDQRVMTLARATARDHVALRGLEWIGMQNIEPDQIKAEAGVEILMQPGEAFGKQPFDHAKRRARAAPSAPQGQRHGHQRGTAGAGSGGCRGHGAQAARSWRRQAH
jgi:hypothetical protein